MTRQVDSKTGPPFTGALPLRYLRIESFAKNAAWGDAIRGTWPSKPARLTLQQKGASEGRKIYFRARQRRRALPHVFSASLGVLRPQPPQLVTPQRRNNGAARPVKGAAMTDEVGDAQDAPRPHPRLLTRRGRNGEARSGDASKGAAVNPSLALPP